MGHVSPVSSPASAPPRRRGARVRLLAARLVGLGPFEDLTLSFADERGAPRGVVVVLGGGGVGKTTLLSAISSTRPGYAVACPARADRGARPFAVCDYALGDDEPVRPHALRVASPMADLGEPEARALVRRREQAHFDRLTELGGFALVAFSPLRWFSKARAVAIAPGQTVLRHDPRAACSFDDAARAELSRDTKQALSYAGVAAALAPGNVSFGRFDAALRAVVDTLLAPLESSYLGVDPRSLEPIFEFAGARRTFDELPTSARHLVAFGALTVRALSAAYPARDPREAEGIVLVDDADAHLPPVVAAGLPDRLVTALPRVQWVLATSSQHVASRVDASQIVALRTLDGAVVAFEGADARLH